MVQHLSAAEMPDVPDAKSANFFINIALDAQGQRLFAAGGQKHQVYVWDLASGQVIGGIPFAAGALDMLYHPARNEVVTIHRGGGGDAGVGLVRLIDATTYEAKRTIDLPAHPNSLAL